MADDALNGPQSERGRRYLKDRGDPSVSFKISRNKRIGFIPECAPSHKGQVYVASCDGLRSGVYKIGKSTDHFSKRSQALSHPTGVPGRYFPVYRMESDCFDQLERSVLQGLHAFRLDKRKEFVDFPLEKIVQTLRTTQNRVAPDESFVEHFYYPVDKLESALKEFYHDFLVHPGPKQWPRIILFLSLISGLSPTDILVRICYLGEDFSLSAHCLHEEWEVGWLIQYLRSLMKHDYLPFGGELLSEARLRTAEGDADAVGIFEKDDGEWDRFQWYCDRLEEHLWDAIDSSEFLRKIYLAAHSRSAEAFCYRIFLKHCQYSGLSWTMNKLIPIDPEGAPSLVSDFHFI